MESEHVPSGVNTYPKRATHYTVHVESHTKIISLLFKIKDVTIKFTVPMYDIGMLLH